MSCRLLAPAVGVHTYVYVYMGTVRPTVNQSKVIQLT